MTKDACVFFRCKHHILSYPHAKWSYNNKVISLSHISSITFLRSLINISLIMQLVILHPLCFSLNPSTPFPFIPHLVRHSRWDLARLIRIYNPSSIKQVQIFLALIKRKKRVLRYHIYTFFHVSCLANLSILLKIHENTDIQYAHTEIKSSNHHLQP